MVDGLQREYRKAFTFDRSTERISWFKIWDEMLRKAFKVLKDAQDSLNDSNKVLPCHNLRLKYLYHGVSEQLYVNEECMQTSHKYYGPLSCRFVIF